MRLKVWGLSLGLASSIVLGWGCGLGSPSKPKVKVASSVSASSDTPARSVYMIYPLSPDSSMISWGVIGQREAGAEKSIFRALGPGEPDYTRKQSAMIREAIKEGASSIVLIFNGRGGDDDLPAAIAEAQEKKVPLVVLGRPVELPEGRPPVPLVTPSSFDEPARELVRAVIEDVKKAGRPEGGTYLVLDHKDGDIFAADRVAALKKALKEAGVIRVESAWYTGLESKTAAGVVEEALKNNPDLVAVLTESDEGTQGAVEVRRSLAGKPPIFVAGFVGGWSVVPPYLYQNESAYVEFHLDDLAKFAVRTALAMAAGEAPEMRIESKGRFNRGKAEVLAEPDPTAKPNARPVTGRPPDVPTPPAPKAKDR